MGRYSLADARARALKPRDSWWTVVFVDPIALRLSLGIANHTALSPNVLTTASLGLGLGAAWLFWSGTTGALIAGALVYHVSFVVDCVDGKVARLTGGGTPLGEWLDYGFDRIRVFVAALALMGGQYRRTDDATYLVLAALIVFLDMLRYLNALKSSAITGSAPGEGIAPAHAGLRARLAAHRIRAHLFSGVEFQVFVFILGPLSGFVLGFTVAGSIMLVAFEVTALAALRASIKRRSNAEGHR